MSQHLTRTAVAVTAGAAILGALAGVCFNRRRRRVLGSVDQIEVTQPGWYFKIRDYNNPPPIKEVLARWACHHEKAYDPPHSRKEKLPGVFWYDLDEVLPYREYHWTREDTRHGPEGWDELEASMKAHGWTQSARAEADYPDSIDPAHVIVGRNACAKVGEGNHRLAVAKKLKLKRVPVRFQFWDEVQPYPHHDAHVRCFNKATLCSE